MHTLMLFLALEMSSSIPSKFFFRFPVGVTPDPVINPGVSPAIPSLSQQPVETKNTERLLFLIASY